MGKHMLHEAMFVSSEKTFASLAMPVFSFA